MKKVLVAGAALMLVSGIASTAPAAPVEPGVKITGDARVRLYYKDDNYGDFGNNDLNDSQTNLDSRVRLNITGTAAGGAYAKVRFRLYEGLMGDDDTDPTPLGSRSGDVWVDMAYVGIPFSDMFTLEVGKYRSTYGPLPSTYNFFYDDVHLTGFRGIIKFDNVEINPFVEWMEEAQSEWDRYNNTTDVNYLEDNDEIRFGIHAKAKLNKDWTMGGMVGYQTDEREETPTLSTTLGTSGFEANEGFFASLYVNGKSGNFGLVGEIAVTDGDLNNFNSWEDDAVYILTNNRTRTDSDRIGSDDTGFGGYVFPNYQIDKLNIGLNLGFTVNGFQPDRAFGFVMLGSSDNSVISAGRIGDTGDWLWAGLVVSYQIKEDLKLTGNLVYADIDAWETEGPGGEGPYTTSGAYAYALDNAWELSAILQYTISKGADVYFSAGYLKPEFEDSTVEDDGAFGAVTRFELKF